MRWNEIINETNLVEGTNFHCPVCDENLGKESELDANDAWYCGNCGWSAKASREPARQEYDPGRRGGSSDAPAKAPTVAPKGKQTLVKVSGDFEARIYPGRKSGGLYYKGKIADSMNISGGCVGEVAKKEDGTFTATRRYHYGRTSNLGSFANITLAFNALKKVFKDELKSSGQKGSRRVGEDVIAEASSGLFMGVASIPNWSIEDDTVTLVFKNHGGHECKVHQDSKGIHCEIDHSWDKKFSNEAEATAWMNSEGYTKFVGVDDA